MTRLSELPRRLRFACVLLLLTACGDDGGRLDPSEWYPGGATTNTLLLGPNAFSLPARNLTAEHDQAFFSGNSFFNQAWVEAPASTTARDGLGPLFNARSCSGCHFRDGKAEPPVDGQGPFVGLLLRLSVDGPDGTRVPDPVYGGQLQDQALPGVPVEALASITFETVSGTYADGTGYTLERPIYQVGPGGYGAFGAGLRVSPRIAPHMIGLGLLEALPVARLEELEDPDDLDGDGISGRVQWLATATGMQPGRFGWKGDAPTVERQVAGAFAGDMGLTTRVVTSDDCTVGEPECVSAANGGEPEVSDLVFDQVVLYSRTLAVPARRAADDPTVRFGQRLFARLGCDGCHVPSHTTGMGALPELSDQRIWPYTDLLLHDMGDALADDVPVALASGREWKTPPLWGLGLVRGVGGHTRFLHDGRARSLEEAILWHGGEAEAAREAFTQLAADERDALIAFIEDL
ncbi:MAG: di-heme oxidoredictase family protein [Polyangiales bacterium]|nr:thiol oxidoreductase [Myxococcales bacterium]MCB9660374.1 thiol oxidoreductase [Sandaracinaceae bacterium]